MEIRGTVAIVTGGTGGLGRCICRTLAARGANVVVVNQHSADAAREFCAELAKTGIRTLSIQADVSNPADVQRMVEKTMAEFGRIDILVNDAAFNQAVAFPNLDGLTLELWEKIMSINLTGPFLCIKAVAPIMKKQERGRIINISSIAGLMPVGSSIGYAVSKAALIHLTRCMAVALAPHVIVNGVAPGFIDGTRATEKLSAAQIDIALKTALTKKAVDKDDVAKQVITFIETDGTNGQTVCMDGGRYFH